jgi:hypothetical protein
MIMICHWAVWERAKFEGVDDEAARMMWRMMGGSLESMRRVRSTGIKFDGIDIDDALPGSVGATMSPCSAILMMSLMAR